VFITIFGWVNWVGSGCVDWMGSFRQFGPGVVRFNKKELCDTMVNLISMQTKEEEEEMGGAYSMHGRKEQYIQYFRHKT
jgi:hypothetical protein